MPTDLSSPQVMDAVPLSSQSTILSTPPTSPAKAASMIPPSSSCSSTPVSSVPSLHLSPATSANHSAPPPRLLPLASIRKRKVDYSGCSDDRPSYTKHFAIDSRPTKKHALRYLSHAQIQHIASFLPSYRAELVVIAGDFRGNLPQGPRPDKEGLHHLKKELLEFLCPRTKNTTVGHDCEVVHSITYAKCASSTKLSAHCQEGLAFARAMSFMETQKLLNAYQLGHTDYQAIGSSSQSRFHLVSIDETACHFYLGESYITDDERTDDERLLVRSERWTIINTKASSSTHWDILDPNVLCRHVTNGSVEEDALFNWSTLTPNCTGPHRCRRCAMEYQIDAMEMRKSMKAIVLTAWRDLGYYKSVFDPRFTSHFADSDFEEESSTKEQQSTTRSVLHRNRNGVKRFTGDDGRMDEEMGRLSRGWTDDDEESATSPPPLPVGGIRDLFENATFTPEDPYTPVSPLDAPDVLRLIQKTAIRANRRVRTTIEPGNSPCSAAQESEEAMRIRGKLTRSEREGRKAALKSRKSRSKKELGRARTAWERNKSKD